MNETVTEAETQQALQAVVQLLIDRNKQTTGREDGCHTRQGRPAKTSDWTKRLQKSTRSIHCNPRSATRERTMTEPQIWEYDFRFSDRKNRYCLSAGFHKIQGRWKHSGKCLCTYIPCFWGHIQDENQMGSQYPAGARGMPSDVDSGRNYSMLQRKETSIRRKPQSLRISPAQHYSYWSDKQEDPTYDKRVLQICEDFRQEGSRNWHTDLVSAIQP